MNEKELHELLNPLRKQFEEIEKEITGDIIKKIYSFNETNEGKILK